MRLSRRALLTAGLGVGQLALLDRFGMIRSAKADPTGDGPTKLLTLYLQGGTRQQYQWWPLSDADVDKHVPPPSDFKGEPALFKASQLVELAPGDGKYPALRVPKTWDSSNPSKTGNGLSPLGYGWTHFGLASQTAVLHGIDQGTNSHASGYIASMCGAAGGTYRAPAIQSVIANHFYERFKDSRPLPCVAIKGAGMPNPTTLPASSGPILVPGAAALKPTLSADPAANPWWKGLDARHDAPELGFDGKPTGNTLRLTNLEANVLDTTRSFRGRSSAGTDAILEQLYGGYQGVSKVLARNVADILAKTPGATHVSGAPYLANVAMGTFGFHFGANYGVNTLDAPFDMVLRLLKSDLTTAVHAFLDEVYYDTHSGMDGHRFGSALIRAQMDSVARLLGEMKATPAPGKPGKSLLDDTLVLVISDFGRTWASGPTQSSPNGWSAGDDHHPFTSVTFAGGGVAGNRQVGSFVMPDASGADVDIIDETGAAGRRSPRAADVVATACRIMGLGADQFFIPGGYAEVVGLRKT